MPNINVVLIERGAHRKLIRGKRTHVCYGRFSTGDRLSINEVDFDSRRYRREQPMVAPAKSGGKKKIQPLPPAEMSAEKDADVKDGAA